MLTSPINEFPRIKANGPRLGPAYNPTLPDVNGFGLGSALEFDGVNARGQINGGDFPTESEGEWWFFDWIMSFSQTSSLWYYRKENGIWMTNRPGSTDCVVRDDTNTQTAVCPKPANSVYNLWACRYSKADGEYTVYNNDNTTPVGTALGITGNQSDFGNVFYWASAGSSSGWLRCRHSNAGVFVYPGTAPTAADILARIYNGGKPTDLNADEDAGNLDGYWYFDKTLGDTASLVEDRAPGGVNDITLVNVLDGDYIIGGQPGA